jgi:hypothetical protein
MKTRTILTFNDNEYTFDTELYVIPSTDTEIMDVDNYNFGFVTGKIFPRWHVTSTSKLAGRVKYTDATLRFPYDETLLKLVDEQIQIQMGDWKLSPDEPNRKFGTHISTDKESWKLDGCLISYYATGNVKYIDIEISPDYTIHTVR